MTTTQPTTASAAQTNGVDHEKNVTELSQTMNGSSLQDTSQAPKPQSDTPEALQQTSTDTDATIPQLDGSLLSKKSKLPHVATEGPIKTPFHCPLEKSIPTTRPELSGDQQTKYKALLAAVEKWTEVPETSARGAKSLPLTDKERMFLTRECLLRYLRATTWNVSQSEIRLRNTLVWRREYGMEKLTPDYISIENATGKQVVIGWDNEGRTCHYMRPSKQNTERTPRQIQHMVFMIERSLDLAPAGQETLTLLINFAETKSGQGATVAQGREALNILQNHYPERLGRALVTNVPFYIWAFFKIITPFIDPITREKLKFNEDSGLHVPRDQLLKESGGLVEFEYDHDVYWPALNQLCEAKRKSMRQRWEKAGKRVGELETYLKGGQDKSLSDLEAETKNEANGVTEPEAI